MPDRDLSDYSLGNVPNLLDSDSFVDALTLCNFCILANVLDFRTYTFPLLDDAQEEPSPREYDQRARWDYNGLNIVDREYFVHVRGVARNFIRWVGCNYDVVGAASEPVDDFDLFAGQYLHQQCSVVLSYKRQAAENGLIGPRLCKVVDLERQMDLLFSGDDWACYGDWVQSKKDFSSRRSLAFGGQPFTVTKKEKPLPFKGW